MWRLWHILFGWHYVAVGRYYTYDDLEIKRLRKAPNGFVFVNDLGKSYPLSSFPKVYPLTWRPSKAGELPNGM